MTQIVSQQSKASGHADQHLGALILTYHVIGPDPSAYVYSVSCKQFDQHMELVATNAGNRCLSGQPVSVTFDDGKSTDHEFAIPILEKHRVRATFFVTAGLISSETGFMNWKQVKEIAALGHPVQSHGWSHRLLNLVSDGELRNELSWSKKELEDRLGLAVTSISLPGGRCTPGVLEECAKIGYCRVYHSDPWLRPKSYAGLEFHGRFMVRNSMNERRFRSLLERNRSTILYYRAQHQLKELGKRFLGEQTYHRIWHFRARLTGQENLSTDWQKPRTAGRHLL